MGQSLMSPALDEYSGDELIRYALYEHEKTKNKKRKTKKQVEFFICMQLLRELLCPFTTRRARTKRAITLFLRDKQCLQNIRDAIWKCREEPELEALECLSKEKGNRLGFRSVELWFISPEQERSEGVLLFPPHTISVYYRSDELGQDFSSFVYGTDLVKVRCFDLS